jgi:two-component system, NtrC family, response regulator AtoC
MARILVVDDEPGIREFMTDALEADGHAVATAGDGREAARLLDERGFDVLVTDLKMPGLDGMALLRKVRAEQAELEVIVLTAHGTVETAVEAMKLGAFEYLAKPLSGPDELRLVVARAAERRGLRALRDGNERTGLDVGTLQLGYGDPAMKPVVEAIDKVARTAASVLLLGESGTGKEVAARLIHAHSPRRERPFLAVNCAAITETLLESELFGHEKGAFTGANERRRGRLELADGGTFFLDEVGELKPDQQAKLLRVLEERRFERVGGTRTLEVDVRWVAATNRDLRAMMDQGRFRDDLYHRLAVFPIRLPPLRERPADILPMARAMLVRIAREQARPPLRLTPGAEKKLVAGRWHGNARELGNTLERAAILADGDSLREEHIWLEDAGRASTTVAAAPTGGLEGRRLADLEREAILATLESVGQNRRRAAELLGIGERTLYDKLKKYGVE